MDSWTLTFPSAAGMWLAVTPVNHSKPNPAVLGSNWPTTGVMMEQVTLEPHQKWSQGRSGCQTVIFRMGNGEISTQSDPSQVLWSKKSIFFIQKF